MFDPNPKGGVVAVALTPDSRYLATLSALPIQVTQLTPDSRYLWLH